MGFNVSLINHVQPIVVTDVVPFRIIGIVAGAYSIKIVFFHQFCIFDHQFPIYCFAGKRIMIMPVGTIKLYRLTVDFKDSSGNRDFPEPNLAASAFHNLAFIID